ncbi:MAG: HNH endonuclease [Clostridiales Family XIII bacterium]|jgi:5-methylcytosine-specific restriction endonuclease McrA|nr:HNH endonuclease [Clostridiales Family XIII bacterium]
MNQEKQMWLVLLYSFMELDGGAARKHVLRHIQEQNYWYKNDRNDMPRPSGSRTEKKWRSDFSYERINLMEYGYMEKRADGIWNITESGKEYFYSLAEEAGKLEPGNRCFTPTFFQKLFYEQICPEEAADRLLLKQLSTFDNGPEIPHAPPLNEPLPKGPASGRAGNKNTYPRNPLVSKRALGGAGYRCEVDANHPSFPRRNSSEQYTEPHHLIPMSKTDFFDVNLDREQNIFSLCSNCHNQIHYGTKADARNLISKLFLSRESEICSILGRSVTLEDIYEIYAV